MNIKKIIFGASIFGTLILYSFFHTRELGICELYCGSAIDKYQDIFFIFPIVFLFSLITFRLRESVFLAWWKFARLAIPLIFITSFIISLELHHNSGGFFNMDDSIDLVYYFIMYGVFVLGSLVQIYRGYRFK